MINRLQTGSIWLLGLAAAACSPPSQEPAATPQARSFHLTLHGYNYTDTEIGSFEVDGQGGGNVAVSTPTGGGGKSTCCITLHTPLVHPRPVTIKWSRDSDTWCEQEVLIRPPVPARPEYFEVHFYRDGHVEVAITEDGSPPRLKLDRVHGNSRHPDPATNVNNDNALSRCRLGY
ncbi:DUF3304 domain-containing protein [Methylibium rhizosphaerae]|uniref:DUF3304 domain-containing protein n=1 Tax=Methylibium rhizosphaerae TaxID=2570323 RepID=UPI00112831B6|nr:DUF3304 domain-containing protein [Methylibium rhizosphaerae]